MSIETVASSDVGPSPLELGGSARDKFRRVVEWAVLAPSSHNTQPWLFRMRGDALELCMDRSRALEHIDPDDRAMVMSCGAALYYARLALRNYGYTPQVELIRDAGDPILLARLRIGPPIGPTKEDRQLFGAIPRRHTNRGAFEERPIPALLLRALDRAAGLEGAWLDVVTEHDEKHSIAGLIAAGDRLQGGAPVLRRELAAWMRPNQDDRRDGIPGYALGFGDLASRVAPFVARAVDWGSARAETDFQLALHAPALLVIRTQLDTPAAWLRTGSAVARLLLRAAADGVSASFFNQPIEIPHLRAVLGRLLGAPGSPQLLLRIGYGQKESRDTPRRGVDDVLVPY